MSGTAVPLGACRWATALAGRSGRDALEAFAEVYRDYARSHPGRHAAARLPLAPQAAAASAGPRHARMMRAILHGYDLSEPEATHAVRLLGSVFHGYADLELSGAFSHSAPDSRESWTRIVDALDVALRHWPTGGAEPRRQP